MSEVSLISTHNPEAIPYEEKLIASPYDVQIWIDYIDSVETALDPLRETVRKKKGHNDQAFKETIETLSLSRVILYERALRLLPGSYKLWRAYLTVLMEGFKSRDESYYFKVKTQQQGNPAASANSISPKYTSGNFAILRSAFERSLHGAAETKVRVMRRYVVFDPAEKEEFSDLLHSLSRHGEAASVLAECVDDPAFISPKGSSTHDLWIRLCDLCSRHPIETKGHVDFEGIVRAGLDERSGAYDGKFKEMEGTLWCKLADFYTRSGDFERARGVYEEGLEKVGRVKDFGTVFDAYSRFEENCLEAKVAMGEDSDDSDDDSDDGEGGAGGVEMTDELKELLNIQQGKDGNDVELALARAEYLMERRPLLLNGVLLRQNPHNVGEWMKRRDLFLNMEGDAGGHLPAIKALEDGVKTVEGRKAVNGFPSDIWIALANLYEENEDIEGARRTYGRVCTGREYNFSDLDDLAKCYCSWVEMELRMEDWEGAMDAARESVAVPADYGFQGQQRAGGNKKKGGQVQRGLHRSIRLWNLYLDLEESLGTFESTKSAYLKCVELGVSTPQVVLNYAAFLEEHKYFEEAFAAFEKGLGLFYFPQKHAKPIWVKYLERFHERYKGTKVERSRELYERCLEKCPPDDISEFMMQYAKFEEDYGLAKRALSVYERCAVAVPEEEKLKAYQLYIAKTEAFYGATRTRTIYEAAIAACADADSAKLCLQYSDLEKSLGEIDRARAALKYGAQLCDPAREPVYWTRWHDFEVSFGNEETFRDMLRIKRSVQAAFSTVNYNAEQMDGQVKNLTDAEAVAMIEREEGLAEGEGGSRVSGFVKSGASTPAATGKRKAGEMGANNDIAALERQAQKIREAQKQGDEPEAGEGGDEEIDIDDL
ncbi:hypothetical protein TrRE_jg12434 [Triparma retinervis]|uniref:Pre-mRNA-splicing factor SYF1 n=1 Tax=Triparma retinervis TaxID=2557542 RepID=A0A9W7L844_9STRA|nr:hypothetical protein TrRE_jg12434 [Triparma retinervis]